MKRIRAHILLFASFACVASAVAVAKSPRSTAAKPARASKVVAKAEVKPTLPDRNPLRAATQASPVAEQAPAPASDTPTTQTAEQATPPAPSLSPAADTATETGAIPTPERNPETIAVEVPSPPDRNPASNSVAMTPPVEKPTPPVPPQTDVAKSSTGMSVPDRNPKGLSLLGPPPPPVPPSSSPAPQVVTDMPPPDPNPN